MRTIGVVTVARSDYGIYRPILSKIQADPELKLRLIVSGMHLSPEFGMTVEMIKADGFEVHQRVDMLLSSDSPEGIAKSMGLGTIGFAQTYGHFRPDILLVLGDRFEMHAAALAALPFTIPVAHIHGGEVTQGAIDDALRHSITKLSHLHFVSTQEYARRIVQLGEEPWRVVVCGAPSLDNLPQIRLLNRGEFVDRFGVSLGENFFLVTYHPVTLEYEQTEWQFSQVLAALEAYGQPVLFSMANADTRGRIINYMIQEFVETHPWAQSVDNLGTQGYFSAMALASIMIGNSSSGIIEAGSFGLPVVNIGTRQQGRVRGLNVIDTGYDRQDILAGIQRALDPAFRSSIRNELNPYGSGEAAECIVNVLRSIELNDKLRLKKFHDLPLMIEEK